LRPTHKCRKGLGPFGILASGHENRDRNDDATNSATS
jgi:hypothetical protein